MQDQVASGFNLPGIAEVKIEVAVDPDIPDSASVNIGIPRFLFFIPVKINLMRMF